VRLWTERGAEPARAGRRRLAAATVGVVVATYAALTLARLEVWRGPIALWSDVVRQNGDLPGSGPVTRAELDALRGRGGDLATRVAHLDANVLGYLASAYGRAGNEAEGQALLGLVRADRRDGLAQLRQAL